MREPVGEENENVSSPSCLSISPFLPSPTYSLVSLLICHFLISSPPSSSSSSWFPTTLCSLPLFSSPTYLICIHLLPDQMCHRTTNYLICLLPLFLPLLHLSSITALPSPAAFSLSPPSHLFPHPLLRKTVYLDLSCFPSFLPQSHPCLPRSLRTLAETFCLIL